MCRPDQGSLNLDCALGLAKRTTCDRAENCRFWHQGKYTHFSVVHWHIVLSRTKWGKNSRGKNSRACWSTFPCCTSICSFLVSDLVIWQNGTLSQDKFITILSPTAKKVHAYTHTHTLISVTGHNGGISTPSDTTVYHFNRISAGRDKSKSLTRWPCLSL